MLKLFDIESAIEIEKKPSIRVDPRDGPKHHGVLTPQASTQMEHKIIDEQIKQSKQRHVPLTWDKKSKRWIGSD